MEQPIQRLHIALNMLKGFEPAHTSSNHSEMLVKIDDKVYKLKLEDTGEEKLTADSLRRHLK